jgi:hypothetical protein
MPIRFVIGRNENWYFFKTGSYWIYEEVNSGARDTVTVYFDEEGVSSGGFDFWTMKTYSTYYDYDFNYRFNDSYTVNCLTSRNCQCKKVNRSKVRPGDFVADEDIFAYPIIIGNYLNLLGSGQSVVETKMDSMVIGTNTFFDLSLWSASNCLTEKIDPISWDDGAIAKFTFSKGIWIIQKEIPEYNQIWQLTEFTINN